MVAKIKEAYKDGISNMHLQTQVNGIKGKTQEGMVIQFWFTGNETVPINSIFPIFHEK